MRYRMPVLAAGALAMALAFGTTSKTNADPLPELNDFYVADSDATTVTLLADAPSTLDGAQATILFDTVPYQGDPVAAAVLTTGANLILAPNMDTGWFTIVGAFKSEADPLAEFPDEF